VVWAASYDAFGKASITTSTVSNNLRFPGQYYDEETGNHYNWNRYYDPSTGRYTQEDPIGFAGGDLNLYRYVGNGPVVGYDEEGLNGTGGYATGNNMPIPANTRYAQPLPQSNSSLIQIQIANVLSAIREIKPDYYRKPTTLRPAGSPLYDEWDLVVFRSDYRALLNLPPPPTANNGQCPLKPSGSYLLLFQSGNFYAGKGLESRMMQSITRIETTYGDKLISSKFYPASSTRAAFINEHKLMMQHGGPLSHNPMSPTYNKIFSPGRNL